MSDEKNKSIIPADLPDKKAFDKKEVFQHPQPAGGAQPLKEERSPDPSLHGVQSDRTSKEEGLNEEQSAGNAGAFEGFEDQQRGE